MSKQRMISTKFWSDTWVRGLKNPLDRHIFIYLLTNSHTNISGIYELPLDIMATEVGIKERAENEAIYGPEVTTLVDSLPKLQPKVYYFNGYVILPNFPKHQNVANPKILLGIQRELDCLPEEIYEKAIAYGYPIHRTSHLTKLNLTKLNLTKLNGETPVVEKVEKSKEEVLEIPEKVNKVAWTEWENYRKDRRLAVYKNASKKKQWDFLSGYNFQIQQEIINTSIANSWQGLFAPKANTGVNRPIANVLKTDQSDGIIKHAQSKIIQA